MLKTLDILIGLSVVMLMVSLIVTVFTAAITNMLQTSGKHLREGLIGLLRQIDSELPDDVAKVIATTILTHPLIKSAGSRYGTVIHREELTKLILELAADDGPHKLEARARGLLIDTLGRNQIADPQKVIENVRSVALQLERSNPELSNNARYAMAFLQEADSKFLAKINGWFDQTIDRVSDRYTNSTRIVTFAGSIVIALILQLDTAQLVNRLSADSALRNSLVEQAAKVSAPSQTDVQGAIPKLDSDSKQRLDDLVQDDVIQYPTSLNEWTHRWNGDNWLMKLIGILLTAMLLSLGAPFWYNALKNLIRLRSLIAQKDDEQRATRQTSIASGDSGSTNDAGVPSILVGERGDLTSIG